MEKNNKSQNIIFHYIVPVWGEFYSRIFIELSIPSLLSDKNINANQNSPHDKIIIATTYRDALWMEAQPIWNELQRVICVEILLIEFLNQYTSVHHRMTMSYFEAMRIPSSGIGILYHIYLTPDSLWSNGSFSQLRYHATNGALAVLICGPRVIYENASEILKHLLKNRDASHGFTAKELLTIVLDNFHPLCVAQDFLANDFLNSWPSNIFFWGGSAHTLVAKCFHLHPVMVVSPSEELVFKPNDTIDGHYLEKLNIPLDKCHIVETIDDLFCIELSPANRTWGQGLASPSIDKVKEFACLHLDSMHRDYFRKTLVFTTLSKNDFNSNSLLQKMLLGVDRFTDDVVSSFGVFNRRYYMIKAIANKLLKKILRINKRMVGSFSRYIK